MKDVSFYEIIINKDDQMIVSADAQVYDSLGSNIVKPMYELIATEDIEIYKDNINNCDGTWHPGKILGADEMFYTYICANRYNDDLIRLTVVNAKDLLNAHKGIMQRVNKFKAQLSLYEDVFFEYNIKDDVMNVYNAELTDFDTRSYNLSEFEDILLARTEENQKQIVKSFVSQIRSGVGRSTMVVQGNILNDDSYVTGTVLDETFVFYDKETEGVVGHIQLQMSSSVRPVVIKHDSLTGLIDKADIIRIAREKVDDRRLPGTVFAIIDIDYFKNINDSFGHQFGDEVIKKVADIISNEVGTNGIAGRFGGDEFFIVLYNIDSRDQLRAILKGIKTKVSATFPDKGIDRDNPLSVSIGAASYPLDADNYDDLFMLADHCLYLAKEKGRNRFIMYIRKDHGTIEEIRQKHTSSKKFNERDTNYGDIMVRMSDTAIHDKSFSVANYIYEYAYAFNLQNVHLYVGSPFKLKCVAGSKVIDDNVAIRFVEKILNSEEKDRYFSLGDFVVVDRLEILPPHAYNIKEFLTKREVYSLIIIRFYDREGRECILIVSSVGMVNKWNQSHFKYLRAFVDILSMKSLG